MAPVLLLLSLAFADTDSRTCPETSDQVQLVHPKALDVGTDGWVTPVPLHADGRKAVISSGIELRHTDNGDYCHIGVDLMYRRAECGKVELPWKSKCYEMAPDTPALAAADGVVDFSAMTDTGGSVSIDHGNGLFTAYHHLSRIYAMVGEKVAAGQAIGIIGWNKSEGGYSLAHLHFDVLYQEKGGKPRFRDATKSIEKWKHVAAP